MIGKRALIAGLAATVVAAVGVAAVGLVRQTAVDTAVPASKHASGQPGLIRQFVANAERDKYAGQCVKAIRVAAIERTVTWPGSVAANVLVAPLFKRAAVKADIPGRLMRKLLRSPEAVERIYAFGAAAPGIDRDIGELWDILIGEWKGNPAAGRWYYEGAFVGGQIAMSFLELALPGPAGMVAGLTADGIGCLKTGFDFVGDIGQQVGRNVRKEYDRWQAAQQAAKEQEAKALEAAKQADKAQQAELAKQAAKQRAKEQAAKEQAAREQAAKERAAERSLEGNWILKRTLKSCRNLVEGCDAKPVSIRFDHCTGTKCRMSRTNGVWESSHSITRSESGSWEAKFHDIGVGCEGRFNQASFLIRLTVASTDVVDGVPRATKLKGTYKYEAATNPPNCPNNAGAAFGVVGSRA